MHHRAALLKPFFLGLSLLAAVGSGARANLITFETRPNGSAPVDNSPLVNPYAIDGGSVRFFFDNNGNSMFDSGVDSLPLFEARGGADGDPQGFVGRNGNDVPEAPGLGGWFVRAPGGVALDVPPPNPFIIDYDTSQTIDALSGEIWDIDAAQNGDFERWLVEVLDSSNNVVARRRSPIGTGPNDPNWLDAKPWTFSFTNLTALSSSVDKVRLTFIGTKEVGVGLAFNNFNAFSGFQPVPEPGTLVLSGLGLSICVLSRFIKRRRDSRSS